ncbi:copper chaperone PCu(A)C [Lutimaribacter marinistellae]|uniref:Copper chaperone PCu(A)C n=1 Tax=Lutimaribacter marinistellae TaxID=1820329 RepID=A0ABV7TGS1_9RHOB
MSIKSLLLGAAATLTMSTAAIADIVIEDAYARASGMNAMAGAAFMVIRNTGETDDRLVSVRSDASARVELHTHEIDGQGVARMVEVEEGFAIPAGGEHALARGGDHVMFMGITKPFEQDAKVPVTLVFEQAGEVTVEIPVDLKRMDGHGSGHGMKHGHKQHGQMTSD